MQNVEELILTLRIRVCREGFMKEGGVVCRA
jgi:hypothetical protein